MAEASLFARKPWDLNWGDWKAVAGRVWDEQGDDDLSTRASAIAYSAMFAIPALLIAVVSIYGLAANPAQVTSLLDRAESVLPDAASELIGGQLESIVSQNSGALSFGALIGLAGAIWSVSGGVNRLRETINEVYGEEDRRPWYVKRAWSIVSSAVVITVIVAAVGLIAVLPSVIDWADAGPVVANIVLFGRWIVLGGLMVGLIGAFYRIGPKRRPPQLWWVSVGTVIATVAWVIMSIGFSFYVQNFGSYNETYGALGSVIVFMTWLYLSAYIVLIAGELNAELEHQTLADTTVDPDAPIGKRGAFMADDVPADVLMDADPDVIRLAAETETGTGTEREFEASRHRTNGEQGQ